MTAGQKDGALIEKLREMGSDPSGARPLELRGTLVGAWRFPARALELCSRGSGARLCVKASGPLWNQRVEFVAKGSEWQLWRFAAALGNVFAPERLQGCSVAPTCGKALLACDKPCEGWEMR
jgi:hypothetical protein